MLFPRRFQSGLTGRRQMLRSCSALASFAFALYILAVTDAGATAQRTFVASYGAAANTVFNCSIAKPCRAFSDAISVTNTGGEVIVLDSAGYGPVTITQSVSITAPAGVYAGISVFSGDGVKVAAGSTDSVTLRGLAINAQGGANGVNFSAGGNLELDRCTITGNFFIGIEISGPTTADVLVKDTHIAGAGFGIDLGGPGGELIRLTVTDSLLRVDSYGLVIFAGTEVVIENSRLIGPGHGAANSKGLWFVVESGHAPIQAHVTNSLIREFETGAWAEQVFASYVSLSIAESELSHNLNAVVTNGGASLALTGNRFVHNAQVVKAISPGNVYTSGTNYSAYNGSAGDPVTGPVGLF